MPTNHNETLSDRYSREHQAELAIMRKMTPEEVCGLVRQLHDALAGRDALRAENERLREERDSHQRDSIRARLELAALKAVPDGVEVVGWLHRQGNYTEAAVRPLTDDEEGRGWEQDELMTVAQHNAIVAALSAPAAGQDVSALRSEHIEWAALFGHALIAVMQEDYGPITELAMSMPLDFHESGSPTLRSAALAAHKAGGGANE